MKNLLTVTSILLCVLLVGCSDKVEYVGDLKDGKPHGQGTITYEDGGKYEGEWKEVERNSSKQTHQIIPRHKNHQSN